MTEAFVREPLPTFEEAQITAKREAIRWAVHTLINGGYMQAANNLDAMYSIAVGTTNSETEN